MEQPVPIKEVKILETAEDIQERREQVSFDHNDNDITVIKTLLGPQSLFGI